jgi:hypothetical protein
MMAPPMPEPREARLRKGVVRHTVHQLMYVDAVRVAVAHARFIWYARLLRRMGGLKTSDAVAGMTVSHNLRGLRHVAVSRMAYLIEPITTLWKVGVDEEVLVVGPRNEGELLYMLAHGFQRRHITAIDLFSYSPWVTLADMHAMPFEDSRFGAAILGWVIAYSDDRPRMVRELVRVLKPGGVVAIGVESNPESNEQLRDRLGYLPGSAERIHTAQQIVDLFGRHVCEIILRQDVPPNAAGDPGQSIVLFSIVK